MAAFMAMTMWEGEFTDAYFAQPAPDPAQFGLPSEDNGSRDDPLLSRSSADVTPYRLDVAALKSAPLGHESVEFPSHHGGFSSPDGPWPGQAPEFAVRLREVLAGS